MRILAVLLTMLFLIAASPVDACTVGQPKMDDLYQVFNALFYAPGDDGRLGSDIELLNSGYFLPDGEDMQFGDSGDTLRIDLTFNKALFGNELGYMAGESYYTLVEDQHSQDKNGKRGKSCFKKNGKSKKSPFNKIDTTFIVPEDFMFADTVNLFGFPMQRWYADADQNPLGQKDHFLSFAINDQSLLDNYNLLFDTDYEAGLDHVWMIAFEELNLGDADYTDLVAVVARPFALNPVTTPLPGAALLLFSGIAAITGFRAYRSKSIE